MGTQIKESTEEAAPVLSTVQTDALELASSMPEVSEYAIAEAEEQERKNNANIDASAGAGKFYKDGTPFDPAIHEISHTGKVVLKRKGGTRRLMIPTVLDRVVHGAVFDVAVDIRRSSPTFGQGVGCELSEDNHRQLWVPPGFGHGFVVLSESADFLYKTTDYYAPAHERCIAWNDPDIGIEWPAGMEPQLSEKDMLGKTITQTETFS
jgi:dTDP-4-dehydrorhamnose 3,5-epimerase